MKAVLALTLTIFTLCKGYAQKTDYAEVNFIITMPKFYDTGNKLYLNDRLITGFEASEIVKVKLHSKGRISVTYLTKSTLRYEGFIDIQENKSYYYCGGYREKVEGDVIENRLVEEKEFLALKSQFELKTGVSYKTIEFEEDIQFPFGKLTTLENEGPKQGTCFLIDQAGYLLTNYHVIKGAKNVQIKGIGNDFSTLYGADVVAFDVDLDLALLKTKNPNIQFGKLPYQLSLTTIPQGTKSFVLGYPLTTAMGEEIKVTEGIVSAKSGYMGSISQYQFSAAIQPGNSGSPLFDEAGNVIGVINAKLKGAEGAGYAIKSQYVYTFLSLIETLKMQDQRPAAPGLNADLSEKVKTMKDFVYIVKTE